MTTPDKLAEKRPYVIVGAFVIGMVLTPPDVISQILLALPMWILFEVGIIFSRMIYKGDDDETINEITDEDSLAAAAVINQNSIAAANETYTPMTDEEMESELDSMNDEKDDAADESENNK